VLRDGPIPRFVHGVVEYLAGGVLIAAPLVTDFHSSTAEGVSIVLGVLVIVLAASTDSSTSLVNSVPVAAHVTLDYLLAAFLIASPFIFGFSDEGTPTAFFIVLGILHLLVTIGTRFRRTADPVEPGSETHPSS
jgi:hypothetical protein